MDAVSLRRHSGFMKIRGLSRSGWIPVDDLGKVTFLLIPSVLLWWVRSSEWGFAGLRWGLSNALQDSVHSRWSAVSSHLCYPSLPVRQEDDLITALQRRKWRWAPGWRAFFNVILTGSGEDKIWVQLSYFQIQQNFPFLLPNFVGSLVICMRKCLTKCLAIARCALQIGHHALWFCIECIFKNKCLWWW